MLSASNPVALVARMRELSGDAKLTTIFNVISSWSTVATVLRLKTEMLFETITAASDPDAALARMGKIGADFTRITIISIERITNDGYGSCFTTFLATAFED